MKDLNPHVDLYIERHPKWKAELEKLRLILLECDLKEELMFAHPTYTYQYKNIVNMGVHDDKCILNFFKGAQIDDTAGILKVISEKSKSGKVAKFSKVEEIEQVAETLKKYISQAIEIEERLIKTFQK